MRITNGMVQRRIMADINNVSERMTATQSKAASGKEITRPSDDPFGTTRALALRSTLDGIERYQGSAEDAQGWHDVAESALARITEAVHVASRLVVQGATDTADPVARHAIAAQIDSLISTVKENANTSYRGQFVFSGSKTDTPPYDISTGSTDDSYRGNLDPIAREVGPGVAIKINIAGSEVLGDGTDGKLLNVLRDVAKHLRAGEGELLRNTDVKQLEVALGQTLDMAARNGAGVNRIEAAQARLGDLEASTTRQLSETEDADFAKTMIDFSSQQAAYQAALKAGANIIQGSLMDFLR